MGTKSIVIFILLVLLAITLWRVLQPVATVPAGNVAPPSPPPSVPAASVDTAPLVSDPQTPHHVVTQEAAVEPPLAVQVVPADESAPAPPITTATLRGTQWKHGRAEYEFASDGTWIVNGEPTAKWQVLGSRVRIYEPGGEEYYLHIQDGTLLFNGEVVVQVH